MIIFVHLLILSIFSRNHYSLIHHHHYHPHLTHSNSIPLPFSISLNSFLQMAKFSRENLQEELLKSLEMLMFPCSLFIVSFRRKKGRSGRNGAVWWEGMHTKGLRVSGNWLNDILIPIRNVVKALHRPPSSSSTRPSLKLFITRPFITQLLLSLLFAILLFVAAGFVSASYQHQPPPYTLHPPLFLSKEHFLNSAFSTPATENPACHT